MYHKLKNYIARYIARIQRISKGIAWRWENTKKKNKKNSFLLDPTQFTILIKGVDPSAMYTLTHVD